MITLIDIYSLSLRDITPPNLLGDKEVKPLIESLDPQLRDISQASLEPLILARIDELPEQVIDLLAWQLHADFYDLAGTLTMKREAVKNSILWHIHKGTVWAIKEALRQIDISAEFVHWHESGGEPYTFSLTAIVTGDFYRTKGRDKLQSSIRRAVDKSKAARSYMTELNVQVSFKEDLGLFIATIPSWSGNHIIRLAQPTSPAPATLWVGSGAALQGQQRILIEHEHNLQAQVYAACITLYNHDIALGVDLFVMQELLLQFEQRILARIDAYEKNILADFDNKQRLLTLQIEELKDMLRWKGDDEEL